MTWGDEIYEAWQAKKALERARCAPESTISPEDVSEADEGPESRLQEGVLMGQNNGGKRGDYTRRCEKCGDEFIVRSAQRKVCPKCFRNRVPSRKLYDLPPSTTGAIHELKVSIDLLERGFEVFRALSPSASCDLLVLKDGVYQAVEVKTAYRSTSGVLFYNKANIRCDILALVVNGKIIYQPPFPAQEHDNEMVTTAAR